jgi:hypothetical protein
MKYSLPLYGTPGELGEHTITVGKMFSSLEGEARVRVNR